jgi:hypothetical protein
VIILDDLDQMLMDEKRVKRAIKERKKELSSQYRLKHHFIFKICDTMLVLMILFNFGAAYTTTALVKSVAESSGMELTFYEANPSNIHGFEEAPPEHKEATNNFFIMVMLKQFIIWISLFFIYASFRRQIYESKQLVAFIAFVGAYFCIIGYDFFNNLGYFL